MNKLCVITGASRGIGLELVRKYTDIGYEVFACCRNLSSGLESFDIKTGKIIKDVDVSQEEGITTLITAIGDRKIDLLINNAGILNVDHKKDIQKSRNDIRSQFEVNSIAPLMVTLALYNNNNFRIGSRIAVISSRMGSISDNSSGSYYGYRMSKAAVNCAIKSLSIDMKDDGVSILSLHPGYVDTDMTARTVSDQKITTDTSVNGLVNVIENMSMDVTGKFYSYTGDEIGW
jgi:NAD(P)-dependent dehydrogenase (short-subunit alcohol dehydrogenase family)